MADKKERERKRKRKSRGDGEGSLFQRSDGKWVAQVSWIDATGKRLVKSKVRPTEAEAVKAKTKLLTLRDAGRLVVTGKATVGAWLDLWLEQYVRPNKKPKTYTSYHTAVSYVPEHIRRLPLSKLPEATELFDALFSHVKKERGGRSAENCRTVLRASFNIGVKKGRIEMNPIPRTETVQYQHLEFDTFSMEEAVRFLEASEDDRLGALFVISLSLGLRQGEDLGLKPEDLDMEHRIIHVRRALQWNKLPGEAKGHWDEVPPKWNSAGDLHMTETIYEALMKHMTRRAHEAANTRGWQDSGYLFVSVTGAPLHAKNVRTAFHKLCDRAGVPRIRFHDSRHSCGTLLHDQGADQLMIMKVLRHAQLSTTARYVRHSKSQATKLAVTGLESAFEETRKKMAEKEKEEQQKLERQAAPAASVPIQPEPRLVQ